MTGAACATKTGSLFTVESGGCCEIAAHSVDLECRQPDIEYEDLRRRRYNDRLNDASFPVDRIHGGSLAWATDFLRHQRSGFDLLVFLGVSSWGISAASYWGLNRATRYE